MDHFVIALLFLSFVLVLFIIRNPTAKAQAVSGVSQLDGSVVTALHGAENDGKLAEGTVKTYVEGVLGKVETSVKAEVKAVEAKV